MRQDIPLFKIFWDEDDIRMVNESIRSGSNWTEGPRTAAFEEMISDNIGTRYCITFNSGTSALHAIMLAYNIGLGDEVIVPSFTFIATANAPLFVGARPVFAEIEEATNGLDPQDVERKITARTKAILPIHYGGCPCRIDRIKEIANDHNLILIEDMAEAFGAKIKDNRIGTFGHSAVLSFCQNKIITTGEGGAVVTDSREICEKLRIIRSQGRKRTGDYFCSVGDSEYVTLGYNFRISDILAALGIAQLQKVDKIIEMRRKNAKYMDKGLLGIPEIKRPETPDGFFHVYQMYNIKINGGKGLRDRLISYLLSNGIMSKVNFQPVHLTQYYRDKFGYKEGDLPITEKVSDQVLTLPMYPTMSEEEMDFITGQLKLFFTDVACR